MSEDSDYQESMDEVVEANNKLSNVVWTIAGTLMIAVGSWTASTLSTLTEKIEMLSIAVVKLEEKMSNMPPADLLLRVKQLEDSQNRMEEVLDEVTRRVHKKLGIDTGFIEEINERVGG